MGRFAGVVLVPGSIVGPPLQLIQICCFCENRLGPGSEGPKHFFFLFGALTGSQRDCKTRMVFSFLRWHVVKVTYQKCQKPTQTEVSSHLCSPVEPKRHYVYLLPG